MGAMKSLNFSALFIRQYQGLIAPKRRVWLGFGWQLFVIKLNRRDRFLRCSRRGTACWRTGFVNRSYRQNSIDFGEKVAIRSQIWVLGFGEYCADIGQCLLPICAEFLNSTDYASVEEPTTPGSNDGCCTPELTVSISYLH
jgi:hypothetical protein